MDYQLIWSGRLWTVTVPEDLHDTPKACATYAQAFAISGGNHMRAMFQALPIKYPGLGYSTSVLVPVSVTRVGVVDDVSESDTSSRPSHERNRSQRPPSHASSPAAKDAALGTSDRRRPPPPRATSNALPPRGPPTKGSSASFQNQSQFQKPKRASMPQPVGWMGSMSTSGKAS